MSKCPPWTPARDQGCRGDTASTEDGSGTDGLRLKFAGAVEEWGPPSCRARAWVPTRGHFPRLPLSEHRIGSFLP